MDSKTEYFVVAYDRTLQWLYDVYGVIGGDILFHRGPLQSGDPDGTLPAEWRPRLLRRSPLALAMVISDAVWTDGETGRKTILGTFSTIIGREFPLPFPHLTVYLALTDTRGVVPLRIRLVDVDELRDPVGDRKWEVSFSDPISVVEETAAFDNIVFPEPGEYRLQLLTDGELLIERRLVVIPSEERAP